jgi:hypothetical protein
MGIWEAITDLVEAAAPWGTAEAEAPPPEEKVSVIFSPPTASLPERRSGCPGTSFISASIAIPCFGSPVYPSSLGFFWLTLV